MTQKEAYKRIVALVVILAAVVVMLFSARFIAEHVSHHCDDEAHCPICLVLEQCQSNIKSIGAGLVVAATIYMVAFAMNETSFYVSGQSVQTSLVSQKVRIDS